MRVFLDFLESVKREGLAPVYLFHGQEAYLRKQAIEELKRRILTEDSAQFNFDNVDGEETGSGSIVSLAETPPFFPGLRLVVVRHSPYFAPPKRLRAKRSQDDADISGPEEQEGIAAPGDQTLIKYLENPCKTTCLVFDTGLKVDQRKIISKIIRQKGHLIEFDYLKPAELSRWLARRCERAGKNISSGCTDLLINRSGRSMYTLENELNKLVFYTGNRNSITREDILVITAPQVEENIFKMVDAISERETEKGLKVLRNLLEAGYNFANITYLVARQFRLILQAQELAGQGNTAVQLSQFLGIHTFIARKILAQSRNFNPAQLKEILEKLLDLDLSVKTGGQDFYPAMEMFIIESISKLA
jgi:DNA polymerase-3 subunit delta